MRPTLLITLIWEGGIKYGKQQGTDQLEYCEVFVHMLFKQVMNNIYV